MLILSSLKAHRVTNLWKKADLQINGAQVQIAGKTNQRIIIDEKGNSSKILHEFWKGFIDTYHAF